MHAGASGEDTNQPPSHQSFSLLGLQKLRAETSHIVVEVHCTVGINNHQIIIQGIGYQCGGRRQGLGESQTGFDGAQMSGG